MTDVTTSRRNRRAAFPIPQNFPIESALGCPRLFASVLGIGESTLHRLRAEGRLPQAVRIGKLVKWSHRVMADTAATGIPEVAEVAA
jgi:predicted DNA-binding transcriptional regulator AlpA